MERHNPRRRRLRLVLSLSQWQGCEDAISQIRRIQNENGSATEGSNHVLKCAGFESRSKHTNRNSCQPGMIRIPTEKLYRWTDGQCLRLEILPSICE